MKDMLFFPFIAVSYTHLDVYKRQVLRIFTFATVNLCTVYGVAALINKLWAFFEKHLCIRVGGLCICVFGLRRTTAFIGLWTGFALLISWRRIILAFGFGGAWGSVTWSVRRCRGNDSDRLCWRSCNLGLRWTAVYLCDICLLYTSRCV